MKKAVISTIEAILLLSAGAVFGLAMGIGLTAKAEQPAEPRACWNPTFCQNMCNSVGAGNPVSCYLYCCTHPPGASE